jgi:hypothetical protein
MVTYMRMDQNGNHENKCNITKCHHDCVKIAAGLSLLQLLNGRPCTEEGAGMQGGHSVLKRGSRSCTSSWPERQHPCQHEYTKSENWAIYEKRVSPGDCAGVDIGNNSHSPALLDSWIARQEKETRQWLLSSTTSSRPCIVDNNSRTRATRHPNQAISVVVPLRALLSVPSSAFCSLCGSFDHATTALESSQAHRLNHTTIITSMIETEAVLDAVTIAIITTHLAAPARAAHQ